MKKIFSLFLSLTLIMFASIGLFGCNEQPAPQQEEQVVTYSFDEAFEYYEQKSYRNYEVTDECYTLKSRTYDARCDFTFSHLSFDIKSESETGEDLYVSIYTTLDGALTSTCISEPLHISTTSTTVHFYYTKKMNPQPQYSFQTALTDDLTQSRTTITKGSYFYIYFGNSYTATWNGNQASGEYVNGINVSNFTIDAQEKK